MSDTCVNVLRTRTAAAPLDARGDAAPQATADDGTAVECVRRPTDEYRRCEDVFRHRRDPPLNTSTLYRTFRLPDRFERPHVFQGYGCQGQAATNNPLYQTTSSDYGWYTPSCHTVAPQYHPKASAFTDLLRRCGMYRNYSLNTAMDSPGCTCTAK